MHFRITVSLILTGLALNVAAQDVETLDIQIVTATRTAISLDDALAPVIVIQREEIERSLARNLSELIEFYPGLGVARNGGSGQTTSVFVRGTESNHVLVLVDGVEINPGTLGGAAVQNISSEIIERVEIVKGPRSALYGSEAIGGVINVITRRPDNTALVDAKLGGGRYDTREASLALATQGRRGKVGVSVDWLDSDGFPTLDGQTQDRGHDNINVNVYGETRVGELTAGLSHWQSEGKTEYFDFFMTPIDQDFENRATALKLQYPIGINWSSSLSLSQVKDDIDQNQSPDFVKTTRNVLDWQNDFSPSESQHWVAGVYVSREETKGLSFGAPLEDSPGSGDVDTDVEAVFVQDSIDLGRHDLNLATRYTDHDTAGSKTTWNADYGFSINDRTRLIAGIGTGFRAPDSTDRFGFGGDPDLDSETSTNYEIAIRRRFGGNHLVSVTAFQNEIDDLIEFDLATFTIGNIEEARIRGFEADYTGKTTLWSWRAGIVILDPENKSTGDVLARRSRRTLTGTVTRQMGPHLFGLDVLMASDRKDSPFSNVYNAGFVLANITAQLRLGDNWTVRGRVENVLDSQYETAAGFNAADRGLYVQLHYNSTR